MTTREVPVEADDEMAMHAYMALHEWWNGGVTRKPWCELLDETKAAFRKAVTNAIAAAPVQPEGGWQTIDSAPKDGTWVLLFSPDSTEPAQFIAQWRDYDEHPDGGAWWEYGDNPYAVDSDPSHWQPLPAPPIASSIAGKAEI